MPKQASPLPFPPVFIIGPPRSGSTLVYQVMTRCYELGYLSNLHAVCYGMPTLIERLFDRRSVARAASYESAFGATRGWSGPSECGPFWYRFFPRREGTVGLDDVRPRSRDQLRDVVATLSRLRGAPLIFKNLHCSMRLIPLAAIFPEAVYLVICRDEVQLGHSLLEARWQRFGNYDRWFSVTPPRSRQLRRLPPHEQVIEQVRSIYAAIDDDRQKIGPRRFLDLDYSAFCARPQDALREVERFLARHGVNPVRRHPPPCRFAVRDGLRIDTELFDKMKRYAQR